MSLRKNIQEEISFKEDCLSLLFDVKQFANQKNPWIAEQLGVVSGTLSGLETGERNGSRQLKCGLELLLENLKMRKRLDELETALRPFGALVMSETTAATDEMVSVPVTYQKTAAVKIGKGLSADEREILRVVAAGGKGGRKAKKRSPLPT